MSQSEDQLDCAGSGGAGITDLVFDDQNQEKRSLQLETIALWCSLFYTSFDDSSSYCSFTDEICFFFSPRLWRVNILVFVAIVHNWIRTPKY